MTTKLHRYFWIVLLVFLAACGNQIVALPTETSIPTAVSPTPLPTSTLITATDAPTPLPTQPTTIPMITPDSNQVERWKEYEDALAKALFPSSFIPGEFLCEWEILGRVDQEVYVWATCRGADSGAEMPAVIRLGVDGVIQSIATTENTPGSYEENIHSLFPPNVQEKIFNNLMNYRQLSEHLDWRQEHPEELPLTVLSATPVP